MIIIVGMLQKKRDIGSLFLIEKYMVDFKINSCGE